MGNSCSNGNKYDLETSPPSNSDKSPKKQTSAVVKTQPTAENSEKHDLQVISDEAVGRKVSDENQINHKKRDHDEGSLSETKNGSVVKAEPEIDSAQFTETILKVDQQVKIDEMHNPTTAKEESLKQDSNRDSLEQREVEMDTAEKEVEIKNEVSKIETNNLEEQMEIHNEVEQLAIQTESDVSVAELIKIESKEDKPETESDNSYVKPEEEKNIEETTSRTNSVTNHASEELQCSLNKSNAQDGTNAATNHSEVKEQDHHVSFGQNTLVEDDSNEIPEPYRPTAKKLSVQEEKEAIDEIIQRVKHEYVAPPETEEISIEPSQQLDEIKTEETTENVEKSSESDAQEEKKISREIEDAPEHRKSIGRMSIIIDQIYQVELEVAEIKKQIDSFEGTKDDETFGYLNDLLIKCIIKLDDISVGRNEVFRQKRREAIKMIQGFQEFLKVKTIGKNINPELF